MAKKKKPEVGVDLIIDENEFVDYCEKRDADVRQTFINMMHDPFAQSFMSQDELSEQAMFGLIDLETNIIRTEFYLAHNEPNAVTNQSRVDGYKAEYQKLYKQLKKEFGKRFVKIYNETKQDENSCARLNLDNSSGRLNSYVLPKFNSDGTHEPWGERDVPWNNKG
jgi:hypothetical protein